MINLNRALHAVGATFGIVAGLLAIVAAILLKQVAYGAWGLAFLAGSIIAIASAARATPGGSISGRTVKATFKQIPDAAFYAILALFLLALVITFIVPPWG